MRRLVENRADQETKKPKSRVYRDVDHPEGRPAKSAPDDRFGLTEAERALCEEENTVARVYMEILRQCRAQNILVTVEAPGNSWFWEQPAVVAELRGERADGLVGAVYHNCMRGGVTSDTVRWVGTVPGLDGLAIECLGQSDRAHCQYLHTQPEDVDGQTTDQLKYTWEVVVRVTNLVQKQLIADGRLTEAPKVETAPLKRIRQKRPPVLPEEAGDGGPRIVQEDDLWFHPPGMPGWRAVRHDLPRTKLYVPDGRAGPAPTTLSRRRWTYYVKYPVTDPPEEGTDCSERLDGRALPFQWVGTTYFREIPDGDEVRDEFEQWEPQVMRDLLRTGSPLA